MSNEHHESREMREITEVNHYTGGDKCQYGCGEVAEFVVRGTDGGTIYTFAGCRSCLNKAAIYPVENEWVDERTDQWRSA